MFLTTYINAVDPLGARLRRISGAFPIRVHGAAGRWLDIRSAGEHSSQAVAFRPDLRVPLVTIITETDLFGGHRQGYHSARQPDNQRLRVWEIAGTAHADNYTILVAPIDTGVAALADIVAGYAPTNMLMGQELDHASTLRRNTTTFCRRRCRSCATGWDAAARPGGEPIEMRGESACVR